MRSLFFWFCGAFEAIGGIPRPFATHEGYQAPLLAGSKRGRSAQFGGAANTAGVLFAN